MFSLRPDHIFGVCLLHDWGRWFVWDGRQHREPRKGETAYRTCGHCNARDSKVWKKD